MTETDEVVDNTVLLWTFSCIFWYHGAEIQWTHWRVHIFGTCFLKLWEPWPSLFPTTVLEYFKGVSILYKSSNHIYHSNHAFCYLFPHTNTTTKNYGSGTKHCKIFIIYFHRIWAYASWWRGCKDVSMGITATGFWTEYRFATYLHSKYTQHNTHKHAFWQHGGSNVAHQTV